MVQYLHFRILKFPLTLSIIAMFDYRRGIFQDTLWVARYGSFHLFLSPHGYSNDIPIYLLPTQMVFGGLNLMLPSWDGSSQRIIFPMSSLHPHLFLVLGNAHHSKYTMGKSPIHAWSTMENLRLNPRCFKTHPDRLTYYWVYIPHGLSPLYQPHFEWENHQRIVPITSSIPISIKIIVVIL